MASLAPWFDYRCWNSLTKGLWRIAYLRARSPSLLNMRVFQGFSKSLIIKRLVHWALFWRIWRCQFWSITLSVTPHNSMFRPSQLNVTRGSFHWVESQKSNALSSSFHCSETLKAQNHLHKTAVLCNSPLQIATFKRAFFLPNNLTKVSEAKEESEYPEQWEIEWICKNTK